MNTFIETLNGWGSHFLSFAWPMLWQSSLLITAVFVLEFALRRKIRAAIRYALWLAVLVKVLLPPSLALPTSAAWWLRASPQPVVKTPAISYSVSYGDQMAPTFPLQLPPAPPPARPKISLVGWSLIASVAVSAALVFWLLIRWRQIRQKVRRANDSEELLPLLNTARRLAHLRPDIRLKLTEDSMSPAVCGLFRPVILLPQSLVEKLSAEQLRAVLLHELIHLRRGDVWVNCAQALLQIVYWWHPLLWLANARIRRVREEAVDDSVMLALRDDAEIYAPTLLEVAKFAFRRPLASLGLVGILESRSALRQRIERLMDFDAPRKAGLTVVSILGILAFSAVALPMGEAPQKTTPPSSSDATTQSPTNPDHFTLDAVNIKLAPTASPTTNQEAITNANPGILQDTNFRATLHALEQRTGVETLAEPKAVTTAGRQVQLMSANYIFQQAQYASVTNPALHASQTDISPSLTNAIEASGLVQDGKLLYEMGKFDDAEAKLKAALLLNPDNQAAHYYMNLVQQARASHPQIVSGRQAIYRKLDNIRLQSVSWGDGIALSEAMRFVTEQSRLRDPDKTGINFIFNPNVEGNTNAATLDPGSINLILDMKNVSLLDVLDAIVKGADKPIKYSIEDYGVVFSPYDPTKPQLEMRVFKVDTNVFRANLMQKTKLPPNASILTMVTNYFALKGPDLNAPGRSIAYNNKLGLLFVRATESEMDTVERAIVSLNQLNPQIHIKARFIEVPKKGFAMPQLFSNTVAGLMTGILSEPEFRKALHTIESQRGAETLAEPEAVTSSGRQTQMRATDVQMIVTNYALRETLTNSSAIVPQAGNKLGSVVPQVGAIETGPILDVVPYVLADGYTINLTTISQLLEFLGYDKATNTVYATNSTGQRVSWPVPRPGFRIRQATAHINLWDGQTLVLGNSSMTNYFVEDGNRTQNESAFARAAEKKNKTADKELLVFITATIVDPAGNRVHSDDNLPFNPLTIPPQPVFPTPSR